MKSKILILGVLLFSSFMFLSSFNQSAVASGSITVTVVHDGNPVAEALVGLSTSEDNRDNSVYISELETNSAGVITFKSLAPGTYYLDAADEDYYAEAVAVVGTENTKVTILLSDD